MGSAAFRLGIRAKTCRRCPRPPHSSRQLCRSSPRGTSANRKDAARPASNPDGALVILAVSPHRAATFVPSARAGGGPSPPTSGSVGRVEEVFGWGNSVGHLELPLPMGCSEMPHSGGRVDARGATSDLQSCPVSMLLCTVQFPGAALLPSPALSWRGVVSTPRSRSPVLPVADQTKYRMLASVNIPAKAC